MNHGKVDEALDALRISLEACLGVEPDVRWCPVHGPVVLLANAERAARLAATIALGVADQHATERARRGDPPPITCAVCEGLVAKDDLATAVVDVRGDVGVVVKHRHCWQQRAGGS